MGHEREARLERELRAISRVTAALHTCTEPDEMARIALDVAIETVHASAGSILLHDPGRSVLVFKHVVGPTEEITRRLAGHEIPDTAGIAGAVLASKTAQIDLDVAHAKAHERSVDAQTDYRTRNMVTTPLTSVGGRVIGVLQVLNCHAGEFDREDLGVLSLLGSQAASAIETARLHQAAELARVAALMGDISHDVKNMLTPLMTGNEMLGLTLDMMFEQLDALATTLDTDLPTVASRLREIAADPRAFSKEAVQMALASGEDVQDRVREIADAIKGIVAEPHFQPTSFQGLAENVVQTLKRVAQKSNVELKTSGIEFEGLVMLDRRRMFNCVYNLVNNAIAAIPAGGWVDIATRAITLRPARRNPLSDPPRGAWTGLPGLEIRVRDNGEGIPEDICSRLFTDDAVSTRSGGTGLGTRIVKKAVDVHGGTIDVESQPDQGTTFTIRIPIEPTPSLDRASTGRASPDSSALRANNGIDAPRE